MILSQPPRRKSRSISRYFLGQKRASIDGTSEETAIHRCLTSAGIFDSYLLWTYVTFYRDDQSYRRLFILTEKNQLIIAKPSFKIKESLDLTKIWFRSEWEDSVGFEISSLTYYDSSRSLILGWPFTENFIVEFQTKALRETWQDRFQCILQSFWQIHPPLLEHVRVLIDSNSSCLIRKVIAVRADETVRDLIRKCLDACHFTNHSIDEYILFVHRDPLLVHSTSPSISSINKSLIGHEYPYSIKMKHLKATTIHNHSFDQIDDQHLHPFHSIQDHSSSSLNSFHVSQSHDFELKTRENNGMNTSDHPTKKHRFFHKRRTKLPQHFSDDHPHPSLYLPSPNRLKKSSSYLFGQTLDELLHQHDQQLPPVIMQLLNILYVKGPETTGIFRRVANTRSVKDCVEKIERNQPLNDDELHPILAACLFKHFLRTLPEPIFNSVQYDHWKKCLRAVTLTERISYARTTILPTLPRANLILLKGLICILYRISQRSDLNGMNSFNLGLCISNSLFKTESTTISSGKQEADVMSSIVEFLIENSSNLFGSDVMTCIPEKSIYLLPSSNPHGTTASSMESLDEVDSSPPLPLINRSHDSGLAASDPPFNDDSSEFSEHIRRSTLPFPLSPIDWSSSISSGTGVVLASIPLPRRRSTRLPYKPSKQYLEREKLCDDTTDESDHRTSYVKPKRTKSLLRHSEQSIHRKESRRTNQSSDVKRSRSLKRTETIVKPTEDQQEHCDLTTTIVKPTTERRRTFVHQSSAREFVLSEPIQMKPIDPSVLTCSPRCPLTSQSLAFDQDDQRRRWSVKEKARFFEHSSSQKFSTGRENYV